MLRCNLENITRSLHTFGACCTTMEQNCKGTSKDCLVESAKKWGNVQKQVEWIKLWLQEDFRSS